MSVSHMHMAIWMLKMRVLFVAVWYYILQVHR